MKLYQIHASGNCYRVRLMLALLGKSAEIVEIDHASGELRSERFKALNPLAEVPVLADGTLCLRDSQAIIVYLARAYGAPHWLPQAAGDMARIQQWLSFAANEIQHGPRLARGIVLWKRPGNFDEARARAVRALEFLDARLVEREWLETRQPTVADVACYPYVSHAGDAQIDVRAYPNLNRWLRRIEALEGFIDMETRRG
jgi:glutathione S-transferase